MDETLEGLYFEMWAAERLADLARTDSARKEAERCRKNYLEARDRKMQMEET